MSKINFLIFSWASAMSVKMDKRLKVLCSSSLFYVKEEKHGSCFDTMINNDKREIDWIKLFSIYFIVEQSHTFIGKED